MDNINISKIYKFKLETKESKIQKLGIAVNQYDSILFRVNIVENKIAKDLTGCNVSIIVAKENGDLERQADNIEITNGVQGAVDIYLRNSCVDSVGTCLAQIVITDDNETIRTAKFLYTVSEILDAEIINEATDKLSAMDDLDKKLEELYTETTENIKDLNEKISDFGDLFSGDYNDLINKPEIPVVDVDKEYVDNGLKEKVNKGTVYYIDETYTKTEIHYLIDNVVAEKLIDLESYAKQEVLEKGLEGKVDKVDGKTLSSNDYTDEEKAKVANFTPYIHPDDASTRHVSDAEKLYWNNKAENTTVTSSKNGLMTPSQKTKLDGVASYANNYTHPSTHPASIIIQDKSNRFVTDAEKESWNELITKVDDILARLAILENK